jgi:hypothetical protein
MSVQTSYPSRLPPQVRVEILGTQVIADVIDTTLQADTGGGPRDLLTVDVMGQRFRVPASDADPA